MSQLVPLKPEDAFAFLTSWDELDELINQAVEMRRESIASDGILLADLVLGKFKHLLVQRFGAGEMLDLMKVALRLFDAEFSLLIRSLVPDRLMSEVRLHNDAAVFTRVDRLLPLVSPEAEAEEVEGDHRISRAGLRSKHARIRIKLAIVGAIHLAVDDFDWVEDDISLVSESIRYQEDMSNIRVVFRMKRECDGLFGPELPAYHLDPDSIRVFHDDDDEAHFCAHQMRQETPSARIVEMDRLCRVMTIRGEHFYVYSNARSKRLLSRIAKSLRSFHKPLELTKDNRGIADEIVAVKGADGVLRVPTRDDAENFYHALSDTIFSAHGVIPDTRAPSGPPAHAGDEYWDRKIYARVVLDRFVGPGRSLRVSGRLEWRVQPLRDSLHALSSDDEHHDLYVMRRMWCDFLPLYAPHYGWGGEGSDEYQLAERRWYAILLARLSN